MHRIVDARTVQLQATATQTIQAVAKSTEQDLRDERDRASFDPKYAGGKNPDLGLILCPLFIVVIIITTFLVLHAA